MSWQEQYDRIRESEERIARIREQETPAQQRLRDIADPQRVLRSDHLGIRIGKMLQTGEISRSLLRQAHEETLAGTAHVFKDPHENPPASEETPDRE